MDFALYDRERGYYARAAQRSGRAGDFFTSVDVGPLFGELLAVQVAEMAKIMGTGLRTLRGAPVRGTGLRTRGRDPSPVPFDLVEAGAGNGRLAADVLRWLKHHWPGLYQDIRLHLVESSVEAR